VIRWTEARVHVAMRRSLERAGFTLIAGEYPGGSDHDLYPLNVTDPAVARDNSPDPRRHSAGELIPDIVALRGQALLIGEAKVHYDFPDQEKLGRLVFERRQHLKLALEEFAQRRRIGELLPFDTLSLLPTLIFTTERRAPAPSDGFSHLRLDKDGGWTAEGLLLDYMG
jgi:hypothetical protein